MTRNLRLASVTFILLSAVFLRFYNLGYSELQDDEMKAVIPVKRDISTWQFLLNQRKGPLQFVVTQATLLVSKVPTNELGLRIPFAILSVFCVLVFYLILKEILNSQLAIILGSFLFLTNGFVVGFGRIAQYQTLNILFSLLGLYFVIKLYKASTKFYLFSILITICVALSFLAHWDAIFGLFPIVYYFAQFLNREDIIKPTKVKVAVLCMLTGIITLAPFFIPYAVTQNTNSANQTYFDKRVGLSSYSLDSHKYIFELYNPFLTLYLLLALSIAGLANHKKGLLYFTWFLINFAVIKLFMEKPGTHIYNYVIPLIFLSAVGIDYLQKFGKTFKVFAMSLILCIGFLYYQSFRIFISNEPEYPWDSIKIFQLGKLNIETTKYKHKEVLTFGFPHFRNWKQVNELISNDKDDCSYITNEGVEISQIYVKSEFGIVKERSCYFIADVKRPFISRGDGERFAKTVNKVPIYTYTKNERTLLRLYKIENSSPKN